MQEPEHNHEDEGLWVAFTHMDPLVAVSLLLAAVGVAAIVGWLVYHRRVTINAGIIKTAPPKSVKLGTDEVAKVKELLKSRPKKKTRGKKK